MVHIDNSLIFPVQIQNDLHAEADDIGHVIHSRRLPYTFCHAVFDLLLICLKIL